MSASVQKPTFFNNRIDDLHIEIVEFKGVCHSKRNKRKQKAMSVNLYISFWQRTIMQTKVIKTKEDHLSMASLSKSVCLIWKTGMAFAFEIPTIFKRCLEYTLKLCKLCELKKLISLSPVTTSCNRRLPIQLIVSAQLLSKYQQRILPTV